ncbi:unnamed protein product [Dibothriocephalus latus]|uniref:Uncharacterized protein n=1 Tax=Dibothriocephalus latus TaxID=60516 RepID=A0A3P7LJK2_DIBLA|nr:unnamed protein product [Dibothriocephalus latus]
MPSASLTEVSGVRVLQFWTVVDEEVEIPLAFKVFDSYDSQVYNLFSQIRTEQKGRLDLLVNNAYAAVSYLTSHADMSYWELDASDDAGAAAKAWDIVNGVGLRNHYICATLATRMMLEYRGELTTTTNESGDSEKETQKALQQSDDSSLQRPGLIINISSLGGLRYLFNVAYGVGRSVDTALWLVIIGILSSLKPIIIDV